MRLTSATNKVSEREKRRNASRFTWGQPRDLVCHARAPPWVSLAFLISDHSMAEQGGGVAAEFEQSSVRVGRARTTRTCLSLKRRSHGVVSGAMQSCSLSSAACSDSSGEQLSTRLTALRMHSSDET